jgi:hypothetical protein
MRENRTYGSEGGEGQPFPTPIEARGGGSLRGGSRRASTNPLYFVIESSPGAPRNARFGELDAIMMRRVST